MVRAASIQSSRTERGRGLGERGEEQRVPAEQHLVVEPGAGCGARWRTVRPASCTASDGGWAIDVQDVAAVPRVRIDEVPVGGDAVVAHDLVGVGAAHLAELVERPEVELALDPLGVGVFGRVEAAGRIGEVAQHVADDVFDDRAVPLLAGREIAVQVRRGSARCRRASSRSAGRATSRRSSSGRSRRRGGRGCRRRPSRRAWS